MGNFTAKREEGEKNHGLARKSYGLCHHFVFISTQNWPRENGCPGHVVIVYVYVFCGCAVIEAEPEPVVGFLQAFTLPALKPRWKNKITAVDGSRLRRVAFVSFRSKAGEQLFLGSHSIIIMAGCQQAA